MATYEVKQGKDITDPDYDEPIKPDKWYVVDVGSGRIKAGPYGTKEEAEAKRRALMAPGNKKVTPAIHFKLICFYKDGVPVDKDVLAETPGHAGNLVIEDWLEGNTFKRAVRYARLLSETHLIPADIIPPLFEPTVIKMTANQMTLIEYQIGARDGAAVHYLQLWAIRMTSPIG